MHNEEHLYRAKRLCDETQVLLKNDKTLPLDKMTKKIALFGCGAKNTVLFGTGSGAVNIERVISVYSALIENDFIVTSTELLDKYDEIISDAKKLYDDSIRQIGEQNPILALKKMMSEPFVIPQFPKITGKDDDTTDCDTAIYVLSRISGEGSDRTLTKGDWHLSDAERENIDYLAERYKHFIVLINSAGVIEIEDLVNNKNVNAILLIGQGGSATSLSAVDILTGKVTPSAKLSATWGKKYSDYPSSEEFVSDNKNDTIYSEGRFVGYRHFDKKKIDPLFEFGFGLSYTDFSIKCLDFYQKNDNICLCVEVKNIGKKYGGKETVQVYTGLADAGENDVCRSLSSFKKTRNLKPGDCQKFTLSFKVRDLAIYDTSIKKYRLQGGKYTVFVGNSSRNLTEAFTIELDEKIYQTHHYKENIDVDALTKNLSDDDLVSLVVGDEGDTQTKSIIGNASKKIPGAAGETTSALYEKGIISLVFADGPAGVRINKKVYRRGNAYIDNPADDPVKSVCLPLKMQMVDLSGTTIEYKFATAIPSAVSMAGSFNLPLIKQTAHIIGEEMEEFGIDVWLAPALNIHRNPLCGRNFEYYSEDPLLSGKCAAAVIKGVQSIEGKSVCIKHLAANNKETNRNYNNSIVDEQTLREIYLKGFEIAVRNGKPHFAMSAYNLINGIHCANNKYLLTDILRGEWGFDGVVMTDWYATLVMSQDSNRIYPASDCVGCIKSGNDLIMPGSDEDSNALKNALTDGTLTREEIGLCAARMIREIKR